MNERETKLTLEIIAGIIACIATIFLLFMIFGLIDVYDYEVGMEAMWGNNYWDHPYRHAILMEMYKSVIMENLPIFLPLYILALIFGISAKKYKKNKFINVSRV